MEYAELGDTGIEVSQISLGLWNVSGDPTWGSQREQDAVEAIETAIADGVTFFDTAEAYGDGYAEELLGRVLAEHDREELVIATKVSADNLRPPDLKEACEASLDRLNTDYVDVYYIHWPNRDVPMADTFEAMAELQEAGTVREVAVSNFGVEDLAEATEHADVAADQLPYSLLWRAIEHEVLPACRERDVGVTCYSPLAQGLLAGTFESPDDVPAGRARTRHFSGERPEARHGESGAEAETFEAIARVEGIFEDADVDMVQGALAWVRSRRGVDSVIVGARNAEQMRANAAAADVDLSPETVDRLDEATADLTETLGANPDMWQSDSRYR
jgi:aryl-alcohol dehydrogenase-like predicted oxidoreductase